MIEVNKELLLLINEKLVSLLNCYSGYQSQYDSSCKLMSSCKEEIRVIESKIEELKKLTGVRL